MLRRNFLKLLGLLPIGFIPKKSDAVPTLISNESVLPRQDVKYYTIVSISNPCLLQRRLKELEYSIEVEVEYGDNPSAGDYAYLTPNGTVTSHNGNTETFSMDSITIGRFLSEKYTKKKIEPIYYV